MHMKKKTGTLVALALGGLTPLLAIGPGVSTASASTSSAPVPFSVMTVSFNTTPPPAGDPILTAIEKATNSQLNIDWVSSNDYDNKLNVTLASGALPDLLYIDNITNPVFVSMENQGAFWNLAPYIKQYPNFQKYISSQAWNLTKAANGDNYGIPRPRPVYADSFFIVRKDWLNQLHLPVPTTTAQFESDLEAFKKNNLGGSNTIPFAAYVDQTDMGWLGQIESAFNDANGLWKVSNGKLVFTNFLPSERHAVTYMRDLYVKGLIPQDFATMQLTQAKNLFMSGQSGVIVDKAGTMENYIPSLQQVDKKVQPRDFYPLTSLNGYNPMAAGFAGVLAIPKSVPEAKMEQILSVLNTWMKPNVFNIQQWGIKGRDYTVVKGQKVLNQTQMTTDDGGDFNQIVYDSNKYDSSTKAYFPPAVNTLYEKIQNTRVKTAVGDPSVGLYSPSFNSIASQLETDMTDLKVKIILGQQPISAWDTWVKQTEARADVQKAIAEMSAAYQQRSGK